MLTRILMLFQVHALETAAIKPDPFNQYVSAGVVSGIATVSIGESCLVSCVICYVLCETKETPENVLKMRYLT